MNQRKAALSALAFLLVAVPASTQNDFKKWPARSSPTEIGKLVAERFASGPHTNFNRPTPPNQITYPESVAWYGALTFAKESGDRALEAQLIHRFEPLFGEESKLVPKPVNVDSTIFGAVPIEIFLLTGQKQYLDLGMQLADKQWEDPSADGLTKQTRFWIDDMYMITVVQVQAYRATRDPQYINRAAEEMTAYLDKLQQPNGLFYHAPDVPFFWGRGNGWVAAGMAEILRSLPQNHPLRPHILDGYRRMMASLLRYQGPDGVWRQLIDHPDAWPETSSSAMFTFAMITGVRNKWLDENKYAPAARKGWMGLLTFLEANGDIRSVCEGTNKKNDLQYYLNRARNTGDLHGQAPLLWCATALLRKNNL